ncbi:MAG: 2-oxo acid dehydrogenase subunit E2, partial [Candidatus Marinimicrobia bacterium]|nr:2-oxo acid dehydrogenase subunit E2 [Candidatus Neomarinimicrobiota bacterium]
MAVHTILMPKLGQTVEVSTIVRWHKQVGEQVKKGEVLFEIETDKSNLEAESFYEGTLLKIIVPEGVEVPVQVPVAFVGDPADPLPELPAPAAAPAPPPKAAAPAAPVAAAPAERQREQPAVQPPPAAPAS